jgi:hypothetical protein
MPSVLKIGHGVSPFAVEWFFAGSLKGGSPEFAMNDRHFSAYRCFLVLLRGRVSGLAANLCLDKFSKQS